MKIQTNSGHGNPVKRGFTGENSSRAYYLRKTYPDVFIVEATLSQLLDRIKKEMGGPRFHIKALYKSVNVMHAQGSGLFSQFIPALGRKLN